jgi:hypothetical protein
MPITMRNEAVLRGHYDELAKFVSQHDTAKQTRNIKEASEKYPEIWDFINEMGGLNTVTLMKLAKTIQAEHQFMGEMLVKDAIAANEEVPTYDPMPEDVAIATAKERLTEQWTAWLKSNLEVAKYLHFTTGDWPQSLAGLRRGIDVVKQTVDRERTPQESLELIDSETTSDFWCDIDATEVARYINTFCSNIGG